VEGERRAKLVLHLMDKSPGRRLYELPTGGEFIYARWNDRGDRIFAVTRDRRLLTLDASTGALIREDTIPFAGTPGQDRLIAAALDAKAAIQAYSIIRTSSDLYLASGIR